MSIIFDRRLIVVLFTISFFSFSGSSELTLRKDTVMHTQALRYCEEIGFSKPMTQQEIAQICRLQELEKAKVVTISPETMITHLAITKNGRSMIIHNYNELARMLQKIEEENNKSK